MSTQPVMPEADDFETDSPAEPVEARVIKPIPDKKADERVSQAASELGKRGGEAAAKARKEAAKEAARAAEVESDDDEAQKAGAVEETADETEDEAEAAKRKADEEISAADPKKRKELASERIREATKRAAEAAREAKQLREENERLRRESRPQERPEAQDRPQERQAEPVKGKPKAEDFESYEDFVEALTEFKADEKISRVEQERAQRAAQEARTRQAREKWGSFRERVSGVPKTDPSHKAKFTEFMEGIHPDVADLEPTSELLERDSRARPGPANVVADYLFSSEKAPSLMLHLSENPDVFQRLATLQAPPQMILLEMAKLEASLGGATSGTSSPRPEVSKAKPPVRPVTGSPHTADSVPDPDSSDNFDEHFRYMNAKEGRRR